MGQSVKHDSSIKVAEGPPRNSLCRRSSDEACDDIQNTAVVKWGCFVVKYQRTGVNRQVPTKLCQLWDLSLQFVAVCRLGRFLRLLWVEHHVCSLGGHPKGDEGTRCFSVFLSTRFPSKIFCIRLWCLTFLQRLYSFMFTRR